MVSRRELSCPSRQRQWPLAGLAYGSADLAGAALPVRAGKDDLRVRIEVAWSFK